ncbi:MAG TPA: hypothetical protein VMX74_14540 [Pirellulales bacterium]|nr:hypothetical protein [Pirellulales bacterium]
MAVLFLSSDVATAGELRVGAATVNLLADDSMVIGGSIGPKWAKGQEGQLCAVAVVIEKPGAGKVAIVACDVLFTPRSIVDAALAMIEETVAIPPSHVLISATHTHHAPSTAKLHGYEPHEVFCKRVVEGIVRAVQQANARRPDGEADFLFHLGNEKTVGANSRLLLKDGRIYWIGPATGAVGPTGPFDPQLPVLAFRGPQGKLRALIYNHSTHTIGTLQPNVRSPSFYGLAAQELEEEFGGTVCFLEGASGSTHNITGVSTNEAVHRFKQAVSDALGKAKPQTVTQVRSIKRRFVFKVRTFDETSEDQKVVSYTRKYSPSSADKTIGIFREMRKELKPLQAEERETVVQAVVLGDVAIVGVPAEYFTSLGIDIKQRSPFKHTYVAELANDWIGYLPDREGHRLGGYQTWMGLHSYAEIGTGERMADAVVEMLQKLAGA